MLSLTQADALKLSSDACDEIRGFHEKAWIRVRGWSPRRRPQWEPCFVAHLCASMGDVARRWRYTLRTSHPGLQLTLSVVFTHQSPYVKWTSNTGPKRCELADLLVAFIDRTAAQPRGIATVIQAKQSDTGSVKLTTSSEQKQFELLSERPTFDVDDQAGPRSVDLSRKARDVALLYGLTPPDSPPAAPRWPHLRSHSPPRSAFGSWLDRERGKPSQSNGRIARLLEVDESSRSAFSRSLLHEPPPQISSANCTQWKFPTAIRFVLARYIPYQSCPRAFAAG